MPILRSICLIIVLVATRPELHAQPLSPPLADNPNTETRSLSREELDRRIAAGKKYDFTVTADSALMDKAGRKIAPAELKQYLKKGRFDKKAYFVLWMADAQVPVSSLEPIIPILESYGVTKVAVRRLPSVETTPDGKRTLVVKGQIDLKSLTSSDPFPSLEKRPEALRPEKLPNRVRYKFASDDEVVAAADFITRHLLAPTVAEGSLFADRVIVNAGAWQHFRDRPDLGHKASKPIVNRLRLGGKIVQLDGMFLQDADEIQVLAHAVRTIIQASGGGSVRALNAREMDKLWTFIAFDISEPIFALETKDRHHLFVLSVSDGKVLAMDELNGLPD